MYDIAIIGKGPAGWSCAMTARMRGLSALVVAPRTDDGWLKRAERIDNYPGLPAVSGSSLLSSFANQALAMGAVEREGLVRQIMPNGEAFMLLVENDVIEAKTVVLAMGAARPKLLSGEEELIGRGVSYCATCDGMLYRGKNVAVLSSGAQGVSEARFLSTLAGKVDYYSLKPHDAGELPEIVTIMKDKPVSLGSEGAGVTLKTDAGDRVYDGVFIFRAAMPLNMLLAQLETSGSFIPVDRRMATNVPGVFAAGDCTGQPLQVAKAVGEGNVAAISAAEHIQSSA